MESKNISTKIDEIIAARKSRNVLLDARIRSLDAAIAAAEALDSLRSSAINENGAPRQDSPWHTILDGNVKLLAAVSSISAASFLQDARALRRDYEALQRRFARDFINISVVGPARQGKSRLLRSISGLDNRCIPAFNGDHCTGAGSIIENGDNTHVRVCMTYKTKDDILAEAQSYLDTISNHTERIYRMEDLPDYTPERLALLLANVSENKADASAKKTTFWQRYVEHYDDWCSLIGHDPEWMEDEDRIMTYVAQHNGLDATDPDFQRYFRFVGVKEARIVKAFPCRDAGKIRLVDTVGLGAADVDANQKMLETIQEDSDAVVFFKFPDANTGGSPLSQELKIFDEVRRLFEDKQMDKWFAFLLNHSRENAENRRFDNFATCENYRQSMELGKYLPAIMNKIVDVTDPDEVREQFLVPLLEALSDNLAAIDRAYVDALSPQAERTWKAYDALCRAAEGLVKCSAGGNLTNEVYRLFDRTYNGGLTVALRSINRECGKKRNEKCEALSVRLEEITGNLMQIAPPQETVQAYIDTHGAASTAETYIHFLDVARSQLTQQFIEMDRVSLQPMIADFKNQMTRILLEDGLLGRIQPPASDGNLFEWLHTFAETHLEDPDYEQIRRAFLFLYEFDFSVRGSLMHKVRMSLYEISRANPNMANVNFPSDTAKSIAFQLRIALKGVQEQLKTTLQTFYISPNEAIFAVCDEFFERISTSEGAVAAWFKLYSSFAGRIWSRELMASEQAGKALEHWNGSIAQLQKYNRKDSFVLSL